ncbi:MAG: discoidin domain-containing protein [Myxococcales bacterium]
MAFRRLLACALAGALAACSFPDYSIESDTASVLAHICSDGLLSAAETGIDCGGGCPPCQEGQPCKTPTDCLTLACVDQRCAPPSCEDGLKNGSESDRDCGGQCERRCEGGMDCGVPADCASGVCSGGACQAPTCNDDEHNGDETGVDCGGSCRACESGAACAVDADCVTRECAELVCVEPACTNGSLDEGETGVDCGGSECGPCASGEPCEEARDCASLSCDTTLHCAVAHCNDDILNGDETALDCGGRACKGCAELDVCEVGRDCQSGVCQSERCVPAAPTGVAISATGWQGTASNSFFEDRPSDAFDGDPTSIWSTGAVQVPGMFFQVDLGAVRAFYSVDFECSITSDAPAKLDIYLWQSGEPGAPARTRIVGFPKTSIQFATPQVARYVRLVLGEGKNAWWCMGELSVHR